MKMGRPKDTWKRSIDTDLKNENMTWREIATDRNKWKELINKMTKNIN